MDEHLRSENRSILSTIAAAIAFPYIWMGLFLLLSLMYGANFFGQGFSGGLVAGLLCIGLLNPIVPGMLSSFVARPIFSNLLGRELISQAGCITGLVSVVVMGLTLLFYLTRDLEAALNIFLATPVVGGILAMIVTFLGRGNLPSLRRGRPTSPSSPRISRPSKPALPGKTGSQSRPGSARPSDGRRLPPPRRPSLPNKQEPERRRVRPPRREK